jgi:hypothetical protein
MSLSFKQAIADLINCPEASEAPEKNSESPFSYLSRFLGNAEEKEDMMKLKHFCAASLLNDRFDFRNHDGIPPGHLFFETNTILGTFLNCFRSGGGNGILLFQLPGVKIFGAANNRAYFKALRQILHQLLFC